MLHTKWPACRRCSQGVLIFLSDYGPQGNDIPFKLWVCHNPECGFCLRIDKGQISVGLSYPTKKETDKTHRW